MTGRASPVRPDRTRWDAVVVGSGFGGAMAAHALMTAGWRVLMLERGPWVNRGPHNWDPAATSSELERYFGRPYTARGEQRGRTGSFHCVGGPSVFYGGVSLRFRERDFEPAPEIVGDSGARWPYGYRDLEPYYGLAERLLGVAGCDQGDATAPFRSAPFPLGPAPLSPASQAMEAAARRLGFSPFRLPLAIAHAGGHMGTECSTCGTCDGFACAVSLKNDLATVLLPRLIREGLELRANTRALRLEREGDRVTGVECVDTATGGRWVARADQVVLAAGALASPHLILASGLHRVNPGGWTVGRFLTRHCNAAVAGLFLRPFGDGGQFVKQFALTDLYHGSEGGRVEGKLGSIQQLDAATAAFARVPLGPLVRGAARVIAERLGGLMVMAEDQPRPENRVDLRPGRTDAHGAPEGRVTHRHSPRDRAARRELVRTAVRVLREAGARVTHAVSVRTFSHAAGTVRMGVDPDASALDGWGRFRGVANLTVVDGSALPSAAAVNPSLTIAAHALRAAEALSGGRLVAASRSYLPVLALVSGNGGPPEGAPGRIRSDPLPVSGTEGG